MRVIADRGPLEYLEGGLFSESNGEVAHWNLSQVVVFHEEQAKRIAKQGHALPVHVANKINSGDYILYKHAVV